MTQQTPTRRRKAQGVLQPRPSILRVRHREGQRVRAADLLDEQAYHIAALRRHQLGAHDWGIVRGLQLEAKNGDIVIDKGFAVDGYGRALILSDAVTLPKTELDDCFEARSSESQRVLDVWLAYRLGDPKDARRSVHSDVLLTPRTIVAGNGPPPPLSGAPVADLDFDAHEALYGDAPERAFPVYLGSIENTNGKLSLLEDHPRRYTRLFAGSITSPDGRTRMVLGDERVDDPRRLAVVMPAGDQVVERLVINKRGALTLRGTVEFGGPAQPNQAASSPSVTVSSLQLDPAPIPKSSQPWRIYTTNVTEGENDDKKYFQEMRVELFDPGDFGNPHDYSLQIGTRDSTFKPMFTVYGDGIVTINGKLEAQRILQTPISTDPNDPRFRKMLEAISREKFTDKELEISRFEIDAGTAGGSAKISYILRNRTSSPGEVISTIHLFEYIRHQSGVVVRAAYRQPPIPSLTPEEKMTIPMDPLPKLLEKTYTVAVFAFGRRARGGITLITQTDTFKVAPAPPPTPEPFN